ncbi:MAG: hypothetical protein IH892_03635 [Planctomycetes bacterium]|nr:hypothetical protein [Planctomycetota bacterium]
MRRKKEKKEPKNPADKVPTYIVTFSDMITLLLTFFVMLLSLADVQDPELYNKGRDSFVRSMDNYGLGLMTSRKLAGGFEDIKTRYQVAEAEDSDRTVDEEGEKLRRLFAEIEKTMTTLPAQMSAQQTTFATVPIRFLPASATLGTPAQAEIRDFAINLAQTAIPKNTIVYVLALGDRTGSDQDRFLLSAHRAEAVATFLRKQLPRPSDWAVYSWGAGPGGAWTGRDGVMQEHSHVVIAVLKS